MTFGKQPPQSGRGLGRSRNPGCFSTPRSAATRNCLAGHLLAAQLGVANGSSTCITGVIFQANQLLTKLSYAGPGSYTISAGQRAAAISLEQELGDQRGELARSWRR